MEAGGRYRPAGCEPRSRTAVIVPHRGREHHLRLLLYHLHPFLQRQQLAYGIYVIHQVPSTRTFLERKPQVRATPLSSGVPEELSEGLAVECGESLAPLATVSPILLVRCRVFLVLHTSRILPLLSLELCQFGMGQIWAKILALPFVPYVTLSKKLNLLQ